MKTIEEVREETTQHYFNEMMTAINAGRDISAKWWAMRLYRLNRPSWWLEAYN